MSVKIQQFKKKKSHKVWTEFQNAEIWQKTENYKRHLSALK